MLVHYLKDSGHSLQIASLINIRGEQNMYQSEGGKNYEHFDELLRKIFRIQVWEETTNNEMICFPSKVSKRRCKKEQVSECRDALRGGSNNGNAFCNEASWAPSGWPHHVCGRMWGRGLSGWMTASHPFPPLVRKTRKLYCQNLSRRTRSRHALHLRAACSQDDSTERREELSDIWAENRTEAIPLTESRNQHQTMALNDSTVCLE